MVTGVATVAFQGIDAVPVDVQVQIAPGIAKFLMVGLSDKAVKESSERVRAALVASGLGLPPKRITINLAPADLPKEGSHYDLPIALGLMAAMGAIPQDALDNFVVLGELGLDGRLAHVGGILNAAISAQGRDMGIICARDSGPEAAWAGEGIDIIAADSLLALVNHLTGHQLQARPNRVGTVPSPAVYPISPIFAGSLWRAEPSKWPPQVVITFCVHVAHQIMADC
jgi:magnesium chelatase family protein